MLGFLMLRWRTDTSPVHQMLFGFFKYICGEVKRFNDTKYDTVSSKSYNILRG